MKKIIMVLLMLLPLQLAYSQTPGTWEKVVEKAASALVSIEYFEEIISPESISNGNRIKRILVGLLVDADGLIITSSSLFKAKLDFTEGASLFSTMPPSDITIKTRSGESFKADFIGKDDDKKVAFIRTKEKPAAKFIKFSEAENLSIGQNLFVAWLLDDRYGNELIVVQKSINAIIKDPIKKLLVDMDSKHTRFALVLNHLGEAVGLLFNGSDGHPMSFDRGSDAVLAEVYLNDAFAELIKTPPRYKKKDTNQKKWLGINMQPLTRALASYMEEDTLTGILVNTVIKDSPAQKAGIQIGDIITEINGVALKAEHRSDLSALRNLIREADSFEAQFKIWRDDNLINLTANLQGSPISQHLADEVSNKTLGFSAKEITMDIILAKRLDYETTGLWVSRVERAGWADLSGLQIGDLLLKVDDQELQSINALDLYLEGVEKDQPEYISFFIQRNSETRFLFIKTNFN